MFLRSPTHIAGGWIIFSIESVSKEFFFPFELLNKKEIRRESLRDGEPIWNGRWNFENYYSIAPPPLTRDRKKEPRTCKMEFREILSWISSVPRLLTVAATCIQVSCLYVFRACLQMKRNAQKWFLTMWNRNRRWRRKGNSDGSTWPARINYLPVSSPSKTFLETKINNNFTWCIFTSEYDLCRPIMTQCFSAGPFSTSVGLGAWRSLCKWIFMELNIYSRDSHGWETIPICIEF